MGFRENRDGYEMAWEEITHGRLVDNDEIILKISKFQGGGSIIVDYSPIETAWAESSYPRYYAPDSLLNNR